MMERRRPRRRSCEPAENRGNRPRTVRTGRRTVGTAGSGNSGREVLRHELKRAHSRSWSVGARSSAPAAPVGAGRAAARPYAAALGGFFPPLVLGLVRKSFRNFTLGFAMLAML